MTDIRHPVLTRPAPEPDDVVRYGPHADCVIDIYHSTTEHSATEHSATDHSATEHSATEHARADAARPPGPDGPGSLPLVILLHGGYWRAAYDRRHLRPMATALAERGAQVAVPEFRRVGGGGEWPVIGEDIVAALGYLAEHRGGTRSAAPILVGHSAGGHLAMWAGLQAAADDVAAVVALAPVSDLRMAAEMRLSDGAAQELLGGEPDERPENYADADPLRLLPSPVPLTIIHGAEDSVVPAEMNRRIADAHPELRYVERADADHFDLIDPLSAAWQETVLPAILPALREP